MASATESETNRTPPPVVIAGAGPTGLLLSLWLTKYGIPHRIIDKAAQAGQTSRAIVMHARILEHYRMLGFNLVEDAIAAGTKLLRLAFSVDGVVRGVVKAAEGGVGLSNFPFILCITQDDHERLLERKLSERGVRVERGKEVIGVEAPSDSTQGDEVKVRVWDVATGKEELVVASYLVGCDGAHSSVRHALDIKMEGGTYTRSFFVADIRYTGLLKSPEQMNFCTSKATQDFMLVLPLPEKDPNPDSENPSTPARLIGFVPEELEDKESVTFDDCRVSIDRCAPGMMDVKEVRWFTRYKIHHRVASRFQYGDRVFLCGDSAHVHSPVGGQGMNTGLGDASNLAWKIATAWKASASPSSSVKLDPSALLATYEAERRPFAQLLVSTTDRGFTLFIQAGLFGWFLRHTFMPYILPFFADRFNLVKELYKRVSQTGIEYKASPMSVNSQSSSTAAAGLRLPWIEHAGGDTGMDADNHGILDARGWQAHVFGEALGDNELKAALERRKVGIKIFPWSDSAGSAGYVKGVVYLVRPDGYLGLVLGLGAQAVSTFDGYADTWGVGQILEA